MVVVVIDEVVVVEGGVELVVEGVVVVEVEVDVLVVLVVVVVVASVVVEVKVNLDEIPSCTFVALYIFKLSIPK